MKNLFFIYIISIILFGCTEDLLENDRKGTLTGTVRLETTNEPLANVKITTTPTTQTVYTDEDGNFIMDQNIPIGEYLARAELDGYVTEVESFTMSVTEQNVSIVFEMITDETLNAPPTVPNLISPEHLATDLPNNLTLKWNSTDVDEDTLVYRVIINNNSTNEELEFDELEIDTLELENLSFGTTYTWQVAVSDGINDEVFSESSQFTIRQNPEYRFHFVQKSNGNYIIKATNLTEVIDITTSMNSSWRPHKNNNASKLAFLQTIAGQTHLMTSNLNGSNAMQISTIPLNAFRNEQLDFSWNTDGSKFIFPSFNKLYKINADGTGLQLIYQTTDGQFITKSAWNYDGSKIAITTNDLLGYNAKIIILDGQGNYIQTIFEDENGAVGGLDFNISGDKLLFTHDVSGFQDEHYRQLDTHIFIYDFASGNLTDISASSEKPAGTIDLDPKFSPNDGSIIFTNTSNDGISVKNIYSISFNDPTLRTLIIANAEMVDFQ